MARSGRFRRLPMLSSLLSANPSLADALANADICRTARADIPCRTATRLCPCRCDFCLLEVESRPADHDLAVAGAASSAFGRGKEPFGIRHDDIDTAQTFAASVGRLDETDARVIEWYFDTPARIGPPRNLPDAAPSLGPTTRLPSFQFH